MKIDSAAVALALGVTEEDLWPVPLTLRAQASNEALIVVKPGPGEKFYRVGDSYVCPMSCRSCQGTPFCEGIGGRQIVCECVIPLGKGGSDGQ